MEKLIILILLMQFISCKTNELPSNNLAKSLFSQDSSWLVAQNTSNYTHYRQYSRDVRQDIGSNDEITCYSSPPALYMDMFSCKKSINLADKKYE